MVESQIYIVYHEPVTDLDVYDLKGVLIESFDMGAILDSFMPKSMILKSLEFV